MKKRISIILLAIMMVISMIPVSAFAEDTELSKPVLSTAKDVLNSDEKVPEDYKENGPTPFGTPYDESIKAVTSNELALIKGSDPLIAYDKVQDKIEGHETQIQGLDGYGSFSFGDSVTFDPNHTGKKDHLAVLVFQPTGSSYDMYLRMYNIEKKEIISYIQISLETRFLSIDVPNMGDFYGINSACFDGKYEDCLVINYQNSDHAKEAKLNNIGIFKFNTRTKNVTNIKSIDLAEYLHNLTTRSYNYYDDWIDNFTVRPTTRVAVGDYDRDGIDELAVTASASGVHECGGHLDSSGNVVYSVDDYTTEVAVIDDVTNTAEKVFDDYIYTNNGASDDTFNEYNVLYGADCAAGDIDGNSCDELIVSGYCAPKLIPKDGSASKGDHLTSYNPQEDRNCQGTAIVRFNGENYVKTDMMESNMNAAMKNGFSSSFEQCGYYYYSPVSLETAAINGHSEPCAFFFNGDVYHFEFQNGDSSKPIMKKDYTYQLFNEDKPVSSREHVCITQVVKGNFTDDQLGRECFAFQLFAYNLSGKDHATNYDIFVGMIYPQYSDGQTNTISSYHDNTDEFKNNGGTPDWDMTNLYWHQHSCGTNLTLCSMDYDNDGLSVKYVGTSYVYTDPQLLAVLQAAPYFKQLGNWSTFMGSTSYSITTAYGSTKAGDTSWSTDAGVITDSEGAFFVDVANTVSTGWTHSNSDSWSESYTSTNTSTFTACEEDTIIVRRIPIQLYAYQVWDNNKNDWMRNEDGSIYYSIVSTRLKPVFFQMTFDQYNEYVDEYNEIVKDDDEAIKLKKIRNSVDQDVENYVTAVPINSTGNPYNCYTTSSAPSTKYKSETTYSLDYAAGSTSDSHDYVTTSSEGHSWSDGIHTNVSTKVGGGFDLFGIVKAKVQSGPYFDYNKSWEQSKEDSVSNGYGGSGTVCNISLGNYLEENMAAVKKYHFDWNFASWEVSLTTEKDKDGKEKTIPVYGYLLSNVDYPGQPPKNVYAELEKSTKEVVVTWKEPEDINQVSPTNRTVYRIYRKLQDEGDLVEIGTLPLDANKLEFRESYSNLSAGKNYVYYVGCDYGQTEATKYPSIAIKGSIVVGGMTEIKDKIQDMSRNPQSYTIEQMMEMLSNAETISQNKELQEKKMIDEEFIKLTKELEAVVKEENHKVKQENYTVSLLKVGAAKPDWRVILSSKTVDVPDAVKTKLGSKWKVLASEDISVTSFGGGAIEGKFTIGFSGKEIERYKNAQAMVYHLLADGTVEELKPTWNEEQKCFTVVTDSFSPFVLAVKADSGVSTGDDSNIFLYGLATILALLGAGYVYRLRRKEEK